MISPLCLLQQFNASIFIYLFLYFIFYFLFFIFIFSLSILSFSFHSQLNKKKKKKKKKNRDWTAGCDEETPILTSQIFKISESDTESLIELSTPSTTLENQFLGIFDININYYYYHYL